MWGYVVQMPTNILCRDYDQKITNETGTYFFSFDSSQANSDCRDPFFLPAVVPSTVPTQSSCRQKTSIHHIYNKWGPNHTLKVTSLGFPSGCVG